MTTVVIGNGILGLQIAHALTEADAAASVVIVGPRARKGCASLAAAAMLNSFAEVDTGTFANRYEKQKWEFNRLSVPLWPAWLARLTEKAGRRIHHAFGTYVVNNHISDTLEDENFDAIVAALQAQGEPHAHVAPRDIPKYAPMSHGRAGRAVHIPNEGYLNPEELVAALDAALAQHAGVRFVDDVCLRVELKGERIVAAHTERNGAIHGDQFVLAPGATFSTIVEASQLPVKFPRIFYGVGASVLIETGADTLPACVRTPNRGLACGVYAAPRSASTMLIGASNLISPAPMDNVRLTSVYTLMKSAMEQVHHNYYRADFLRVNVGWRPTSEDTLPLLGRSELPNLLVATGTKRDGLHCSPVIAQHIADLVNGKTPQHSFPLFAPNRAPLRIYTRAEAIRSGVRQTMNAAFQHDFVPAKNRMVEELTQMYTADLEALHDKAGAHDWGIPPELINMVRYGHMH